MFEQVTGDLLSSIWLIRSQTGSVFLIALTLPRAFPHTLPPPSFMVIWQGRGTFLSFIFYVQEPGLLGYMTCLGRANNRSEFKNDSFSSSFKVLSLRAQIY